MSVHRPVCLSPKDPRDAAMNERLPSSDCGADAAQVGHFRTTDWSAVLSAGAGESAAAEAALAKLCGAYWFPLYAFVRRQGYTQHDAQDLAQGFFMRLVEKKILRGVDRQKGKFRSFLLSSIKNFLANDWDRRHALKRGGRCSFISCDEETAEKLFQRGTCGQRTPEEDFDRTWAMVLLETVRSSLKREFIAAEKSSLFDALEPCVSGDKADVSYADLAERLGITEGAVKMAAVRLRKRYRELLRTEISKTIGTGEEIDEEIRYLLAVLGRQ